MSLREKHFMYVQYTVYSIYTGRDRSLEVESSQAKFYKLRNRCPQPETLLFLVNAEIVDEHLSLEVPPVALPRRFASWDNTSRRESAHTISQYSSTML